MKFAVGRSFQTVYTMAVDAGGNIRVSLSDQSLAVYASFIYLVYL
jgi:hypothetical protein